MDCKELVKEVSEFSRSKYIIDAVEKRCEEGVIVSLEQMAFMTSRELAEWLDIEDKVDSFTIDRFLLRVREKLGYVPRAASVAQSRLAEVVVAYPSYVREFDEKTPWRGVRPRYIFEWAGPAGVGKSLMAMQVAASLLLHTRRPVLYVDTENAFSPTKFWQIVKRIYEEGNFNKKFPLSDVEDLVVHVVVADVHELERILMVDAWRVVAQYGPLAALVIDSIIELYRAQFMGREKLQERQQRLHYTIDITRRFALRMDVAVVYTNQVIDVPSGYFEIKRPAGGNVLAHTVNARFLMFLKGDEESGVMKPLDVVGMSKKEVINYKITDAGLV